MDARRELPILRVSMCTVGRVTSPSDGVAHAERVRLEALRYAVNDEAASYIAIMRLFAGGISGLLSDQSAAEITEQLAVSGLDLDTDTVDARLSYLVEHGNLARSPRETEARNLQEYLASRARYQLTQRGELVHRHVEELLGHSDVAREVSSEMLGGILETLTALLAYDLDRLEAVDPDDLARPISTVFAQFERLVESTRAFYTYLSEVLVRYDLGREEFLVFKTALLDYLQRFVEEISQHMPQIAERLRQLEPRVPVLCVRANAGSRLRGLNGEIAQRARGLDPSDWPALHAWFVGGHGRDADADGVRRLATEAMRALLVNLRRIVSHADRERSRYADVLKVARWFDASDDVTAHALWASTFGLYSCRHLSFAADDPTEKTPPTASWWDAPKADVPVMLRERGERRITGKTGRRADYAAAKDRRLAEREAAERRRTAALRELAALAGPPGMRRASSRSLRMSDDARRELLDLYARCLTSHGGAVRSATPATAVTALPGADAGSLCLLVCAEPGRDTVVASPSGELRFVDLSIALERIGAGQSGGVLSDLGSREVTA